MTDLSRTPEAIDRAPTRTPVCGVVVTFFPDLDPLERIQAIAGQCNHVIIVDNGSPPEVFTALKPLLPAVELLLQPANIGLAAAMNVGLRRAIELGYSWAVTFDQDSKPESGMVVELLLSHDRHPRAAVVGPRIVEEGIEEFGYRWIRRHPFCRLFFQRIRCRDRDLDDVTLLISSGSLIDLRFWEELQGFDKDLFIDYVDSDYCLKVFRSERNIVVSAAATLQHRLGARRRGKIFGKDLRPMHHAPFRHYFMARNRVRIWRRHALAVPHWAFYDFAFAFLNGFRVVAFEAGKWRKLKAMFLGTWDGLRGKTGGCPADRLQAFQL